MSVGEIKVCLRKTEFPQCARDALAKVGQLICGRVPNIKHMDLALDLMAEFVFAEVDRRGNKRTSALSALNELQLIEVLFEYFNNETISEVAKNSVFLSLFSGTTAQLRAGILSKLVSVAIGTSSQSVLISAGTWMQQLGNTSANSCKLGETLVRDYFILLPSAVHRLQALPTVAPQFTANFLTAIGEIYFTDSKNNQVMFPPICLLETVTLWVTENHKLSMAGQQIPSALPQGAIAMEATTPLAGLLKWCILAPLYQQDAMAYSKLHLALLNSIVEIPRTNPPRAISSAQLTFTVLYINRYMLNSQSRIRKKDLPVECIGLCLDRFAQAVQVALFMNCVYGNIGDLINQLAQLPKNRLLEIVIETHKQNKLC